MSDILDRAGSIIAQQPHITYPSRSSAEHVHRVMRELAQALIAEKVKHMPPASSGRNVFEAAKVLAAADDARLADIAHRDPDMIRDVAAAHIYSAAVKP